MNAAWRTDETPNARRDLGTIGITPTGHAYAWCARVGHYHVTNTYPANDDRVTRYDVCARPNGVQRKSQHARWPMRYGQGDARPAIRVATIADARNDRVASIAWHAPDADTIARYREENERRRATLEQSRHAG